MNTSQLIQILKQANVHLASKHDVGVFAADKLPIKFSRPAAFIANTDESHAPGTHWVSFYFPRHGRAEYFDSYALKPISPHHLKFLNANKPWTHNTKEMQDVYSSVCGIYSVFFLISRMKGNTLTKFQSIFSTNSKKNDALISKVFKKYKKGMKHCKKHQGQTCCAKTHCAAYGRRH